MMRVAIRADQIDDFHLPAADLSGKIPEKWMQHGDFQFGRAKRNKSQEKSGEQDAKHVGNLPGFVAHASVLRLNVLRLNRGD
jgi:hypothetical protein